MTAATVGIVSAPPVMSRNSVITAVPARIFPIRKNPATAMRAPIVINDKKDAGVHCMSASFLLFQTTFRSFGNVIVSSVPLPISLTIFSVPPRKVTPCLTIERPSPVRQLPWNGSYPHGKIFQIPCFWSSPGIPIPIVFDTNLHIFSQSTKMNTYRSILFIILDTIVA